MDHGRTDPRRNTTLTAYLIQPVERKVEMNPFDSVFDKLVQHATESSVELHPSFRIELENYTRHDFVRELEVNDLRIVVKGLGEHAISRSAGEYQTVGAGVIRQILAELCKDAFGDCSLAAVDVLSRANRPRAVIKLRELIETRYGELR